MAWAAQPGPQADALTATWCTELFFGGARGGGKSDYLLGDFLQDVPAYGAAWQGILFRRTYPELQQLIRRSQAIYPRTGARWHEQDKEWRWSSGAVLRMRYLEREADASRYQGHEYTWIGWDELTQWASDAAYKALRACLRSAAAVPDKRVRSTGNPGGPGHQWVKAYFVDPAPLGGQPVDDPVTGMSRMFIRSRVEDNRVLMAADPTYVARLRGVGSPELVRAWLEGDWSVITGAYFTEFGPQHVIRPIALPVEWTRFRAMDWGSARPFAVHWFAVSDGTLPGIAKGALVLYREWYGAAGPNVGLKMTAEQVAAGVLSREMGDLPPDRRMLGVADPAMFAEDGGPSIAERQARTGCLWRPADNKRLPGWDQVRSRLVGDDDGPQLLVFSTAVDLIRTLPALQHDEDRLEDLDSEGEDHAADALRYGCMSRPYVRPAPVAAKPRWGLDLSFNELRDRAAKKRRAMED